MTQWIFSNHNCSCDYPQLKFSDVSVSEDRSDLSRPAESFQIDSQVWLMLPGDLFPVERYAPIAELGVGSEGRVYKCYDRQLDKIVAVKCLIETAESKILSFNKEARLLSRIQHENILRAYDFGISGGGNPFMVLEYFEGKPLDSLFPDLQDDEQLALRVFIEIAIGMEHLHNIGVFHRDLKPGNVLCDLRNRAKPAVRIIDFGLSVGESASANDQPIGAVGTPAYMAPELTNISNFSNVSEVYSFGCLMYATLANHPPLIGESFVETLSLRARQAPVPLNEMSLRISAALSGLIDETLKADPAKRTQSMTEVRKHLEQVLVRTGVAPPLVAPPRATSKQRTITVKQIAGATAAALLICGIGLSVIWPSIRPPQQIKSPKKFGNIPSVQDGEDAAVDVLRRAKENHMRKVVLQFECTDTALEALNGSDVEVLDIADSLITAKAFKALARCPQLKRLNLNRSSVTSLSGIRALIPLQSLSLSETAISDRALDELQYMQNLQALFLRGTLVTDGGLASLRRIRSLISLDLSLNNITDKGIDALRGSSLTTLHLSQTKITPAGLERLLKGTPNLRLVVVDGCPGFSDEIVKNMAAKTPGTVIHYRSI